LRNNKSVIENEIATPSEPARIPVRIPSPIITQIEIDSVPEMGNEIYGG